jgi:SAM-dependent methyltransferase
MQNTPAELRERFDAVGPWFTRYEIGDVGLGGDNSYDEDYRVGLFFEWLGEPRTILELSSFEGGHSLQLADPPFVEQVVGLEGRPENIERAKLAVELLGRGNTEFVQVDLDRESLSLEQYGTFDAVFCAGLLYHLTHPWFLIEKVAEVTDRFFLDTHYSKRDDVRIGDYVGSRFKEGGYNDPLSGLSEASFWMTLPCLKETLEAVGFQIRHERIVPDWAGAGPRVHLAAVKGAS